MREILVGLGLPPHHEPSIATLLDYLSNMVYCIELMLKLLSSNWTTHNVGKMYEQVTGAPHSNVDLMNYIEGAIKDQKYLFEPAGGLEHCVPDIESLFDELNRALKRKYFSFEVNKKHEMPIALAEYLRDNATKFYSKQGPTVFCKGVDDVDAERIGNYRDELLQQTREELIAIREFFDNYVKTRMSFTFGETVISLF